MQDMEDSTRAIGVTASDESSAPMLNLINCSDAMAILLLLSESV